MKGSVDDGLRPPRQLARRGVERRLVYTGCQYSFDDLALALAPCERPTASSGPSALNMKSAQHVAKATREPTLSKPSSSTAGPSDEVSGASPVTN
ncbi:hypothetical protein HPB50_026426 [Hyalomma asiaticum]|uniref:Uncharacterized protein n=1 Tax=Hyalomma asiaticum TaxID=266040 RepID=A0ACB7RT91_HYAAI|nr:hypothetical protein HPB50_026426 [Hyalomma asiaticum]